MVANIVVVNKKIKDSLERVHPRHSHGHEHNSVMVIIVKMQLIDVMGWGFVFKDLVGNASAAFEIFQVSGGSSGKVIAPLKALKDSRFIYHVLNFRVKKTVSAWSLFEQTSELAESNRIETCVIIPANICVWRKIIDWSMNHSSHVLVLEECLQNC